MQLSAQFAKATHAALFLHAKVSEQHEPLRHALHAPSLAASGHVVLDEPELPPTPPKTPPELPMVPVVPEVPDVPDVPDAPDVPDVPLVPVPVPVVVPLHATTARARTARAETVSARASSMKKS